MTESILWEEELPGGATWSQILEKGMALRVTDSLGGANVAALFYNARNPSERYNMPDTLKAQHTARLTAGLVLYSDMGRILMSITHDTVGWHDPLGGTLTAAQLSNKFGEKSYQEFRNDWTQAPREALVLELAKHSLQPRDLTPTLNLFSKVQVDGDGTMRYVPGHSAAGSFIEMRAEMPVLILLNANHHPLDDAATYAPKPVHLAVKRVPPAADDDACRLSRAENQRGFAVTARYVS